jgi:hypothetical protein
MRYVVVGIVILVVVAGAAAFLLAQPKAASPSVTSGSDCSAKLGQATVDITYTESNEFSPSCVQVSAETKLIYHNNSKGPLQVGADPHPIHDGNKELSNGEFVLEVPQGGTASSVVHDTGTFGLHNHVNSGATATVEVK